MPPPKFNEMNKKVANINEVVVCEYVKSKKGKELYVYAVANYLLAGLGYMSIDDFIKRHIELTGRHKKTVNSWITLLKKKKYIRIRKGVIYIKGKAEIEKNYDCSRTYIQFYEEQLKSYSNFQTHVIRQVALLVQRRMKYAMRKDLGKKDATSLINTGVIETNFAFLKSAKQVGCSISKLQEKLGLNERTISEALKGHTIKQWNSSGWIKGTIARVKYGDFFNDWAGNSYHLALDRATGKQIRVTRRDMDYRWSFDYREETDEYEIKYALASKIDTPSFLVRRR